MPAPGSSTNPLKARWERLSPAVKQRVMMFAAFLAITVVVWPMLGDSGKPRRKDAKPNDLSTLVTASDPNKLGLTAMSAELQQLQTQVQAITRTLERMDTGDEFYQDVMSLTGTLIVCVPGVGGCRAPEFDTSSREKEPVAFPIRGTVRFMDLVLGSRSGPLTFLRCSGECLDVTPMPVVTYKGMADRVVDVLSGTQGAYGDDGGLIGKFARNLGAFTDKERGFMTGMGAYTSKALALARRNEAAAHQFVAAFAPELGAEILANYIDRIVASSIIAVDLRGTDATGQMRQMLDEVRRGIRDDRAAIAQSISGQAQLMAYFDALLRNSEAPYVPPRAYTIPGSE